MKKILASLVILIILLTSCSGSDSYQGKWKATDATGKKFEITFSPKNFTVKDSTGAPTEYAYTQNQYQFENGSESYGIHLSDGRGYVIYFPNGGGKVGMIKDENGAPLYTISRTDYVKYEDVYKLK